MNKLKQLWDGWPGMIFVAITGGIIGITVVHYVFKLIKELLIWKYPFLKGI